MHFDTFRFVVVCPIKNYLISESKLIAWPVQFLSVLTIRITRERFESERTRNSAEGRSVCEMGRNAGVLPRKFFSFHCLENESNELNGSNTEGAENSPDLPRTSDLETVVVARTEISPTKRLTVLHVVAVD